MDETTREKPEKVDWNLSGAIIQQCAVLLSKATTYILDGKDWMAFTQLSSLRQLIVFKLNPEERKDMKEREEALSNLFPSQHILKNTKYIGSTRVGGNIPTQEQIDLAKKILKDQSVKKLFMEYHENLLDLMNKYGFMMGIKMDRTKVGW